jgi:hypothetical protein
MNQELKALAEKYFAAYPGENVLHISGDGQVFLHKNYNDGVNHQRRIDEKQSLISITRKMLVDKEEEEDVDLSKIPDDSWKVQDIKSWLATRGIAKQGNVKKADLLESVNEVLVAEQNDNAGGEGKQGDEENSGEEGKQGDEENSGEEDETKND